MSMFAYPDEATNQAEHSDETSSSWELVIRGIQIQADRLGEAEGEELHRWAELLTGLSEIASSLE